jgi:FkbM family methyltransferase
MSIRNDFRVSYAQNREDIIIDAFFPDVKKGFYVDVGANHPVDDSVTKLFYDKGWRGLNIEPNKQLHTLLMSCRSSDVNLNVGVSNEPKTLTLRQYSNHGLSTFSESMMGEYSTIKSSKTDKYEDVKVEVDTLANILKNNGVKHISFLKVDVEGFEYEVFESNDWSKYRPELICVEANHVEKDWRPILAKAKYEVVFFDGLNEYYLSRESIHRKNHFDYANAVILGRQIITPGILQLISGKNNPRIAELEQEVVRLEQMRETLQAQRAALFSQLQQYQGIKAQVRTLLYALNQSVQRRVGRINRPIVGSPPESSSSADSPERLHADLVQYDRGSMKQSRLIGGASRKMLAGMLLYTVKAFFGAVELLIRFTNGLLRSVK